MIVIKSGALFIADAHFLPEDDLSALAERFKDYAQVILLGDFFAALFGGVKSSESAYKDAIKLIDQPNVIIFEGNHDFNLSHLFKKARVISAKFNKAKFINSFYKSALLNPQNLKDAFLVGGGANQLQQGLQKINEQNPAKMKDAFLNNPRVLKDAFLNTNPANLKDAFLNNPQNLKDAFFIPISARGYIQHGDVFLPPITAAFLKILRSKIFLKIANMLDINGSIFNYLLEAQRKKQLYKKLPNFSSISATRLNHLSGLIIEGHFHQGEYLRLNNASYYNLKAFAVSKNGAILENDFSLSNKQLT